MFKLPTTGITREGDTDMVLLLETSDERGQLWVNDEQGYYRVHKDGQLIDIAVGAKAAYALFFEYFSQGA